MNKLKAHVVKHKTAYISGGVGVLAGTAGILVGRNLGTPQVYSKNQINALMAWKPKQTIEVFVEALGDPGNIIQDLTTGTIYASQGQAARELGLSASEISKHLNGRTPNVRGHEFARLGKAVVS